MMNKQLPFSSFQSKHHQLSTPYVHRQGMKVFPQEASQQIVDCEQNGHKIYGEMIKERLQPHSIVRIFAPVKRLQLNFFQKYLRKTLVKLRDHIVQLGDDANFWRKVAIISKSREIDCNKIVRNYEVTITPRCLTDRMRFFSSGHKRQKNFCLF